MRRIINSAYIKPFTTVDNSKKVRSFKIISLLIAIAGITGIIFGVTDRNIEFALISLIGAIALNVALWTGICIYWREDFIANPTEESFSSESSSMAHIKKMNEDSRQYGQDLINNPKFNSLTSNIHHRH